jgi:hypothetical protein
VQEQAAARLDHAEDAALSVVEQELLTPAFVERVLATALTRVPTQGDVGAERTRIETQLHQLLDELDRLAEDSGQAAQRAVVGGGDHTPEGPASGLQQEFGSAAGAPAAVGRDHQPHRSAVTAEGHGLPQCHAQADAGGASGAAEAVEGSADVHAREAAQATGLSVQRGRIGDALVTGMVPELSRVMASPNGFNAVCTVPIDGLMCRAA